MNKYYLLSASCMLVAVTSSCHHHLHNSANDTKIPSRNYVEEELEYDPVTGKNYIPRQEHLPPIQREDGTTATDVNIPQQKIANYVEHVVVRGDTVWGLAKHYKVTQQAIIQVNDLVDATRINVGQVLKIPVN